MLKHEVRSFYLHKRSLLTGEELTIINADINLLLRDLINDEIHTVHVYLPIASKQEIDTRPFIRFLWRNQKQVVVPVLSDKQHSLTSCKLTETTELKLHKWGVPQPVDCHFADDNEIDLVVIPLLAFDLEGYRVGYGHGFYDRFLKTLDSRVIKIGLSHFPAIDKISDVDSWDVGMHYCVTPEKIIRF